MKEIGLFQDENNLENIDLFLSHCYGRELKYFASDLLNEGIQAQSISYAVKASIAMADTGGLEVIKHFRPVYSYAKGKLIPDCRLSRIGWNLLLLNLPPADPAVTRIKLRLCQILTE